MLADSDLSTPSQSLFSITKTCLFKYTDKFTHKNENFQIKKNHTSAQNRDCGYSQSLFLSRNKNNNEYPVNHSYTQLKVGFKGVKIIQGCFHNGVYKEMFIESNEHNHKSKSKGNLFGPDWLVSKI